MKPLFTVVTANHHCSLRLLADAVELWLRHWQARWIHRDQTFLTGNILDNLFHSLRDACYFRRRCWNDDLWLWRLIFSCFLWSFGLFTVSIRRSNIWILFLKWWVFRHTLSCWSRVLTIELGRRNCNLCRNRLRGTSDIALVFFGCLFLGKGVVVNVVVVLRFWKTDRGVSNRPIKVWDLILSASLIKIKLRIAQTI